MRLESSVPLVPGTRVHDVGVDAVAVDLGDAERQVDGVVLAQPVDEHVKAASKAAIEPDCVKSVVDQCVAPPASPLRAPSPEVGL